MSKQLINKYRNKIHNIVKFGGSRAEGAISRAFGDLLEEVAEKKSLMLVEQLEIDSTKGTRIRPDGTLKNAMQLNFGFWEAKKADVDLEHEIQEKINRGYPLTNTIFEDSQTAILYQQSELVFKAELDNDEQLERLISYFFEFEPPQIKEFNKALDKFKENVPDIVQSLRALMDGKAQTNEEYRSARDEFLEITRSEINPEITAEDVREMMIQHILTEDIFNAVFDETGFHRENNIAKKLEDVIGTFMTRGIRKNYLANIEHYYKTIRNEAARIADHNEKQKFLKVIYEEFYKVYNPKGADRLGVVYTPNEIVRFMIESTDYLIEKHFGRNLQDENVEILDPATGTGTFITDLIDYIAPQYLEHKFKHEIHANEVAILPYYIANLNIEFTYQQKMNDYKEFKNICFVDTLDNTDALDYIGKQSMLFGLSSENAKRISEQNKRKISVVIGNPPYNANQANFNDFNSNREYDDIDKRIKDTYVKESTAQKTKVYDMYSRFYRWAMDRVDKDGIIAFVTNRSFIDSRTYDGFRKSVQEDFEFAYIIDTKSDVRANPKIAGTSHNVFGIQTGVAIMFLIRKAETRSDLPCKIYYTALDDFTPKKQKLDWLQDNKLESISFETINHSKRNNWLNLTDNDFEEFIPICDKDVKRDKKNDKAIFELFSLGIATNRDAWNYDVDKENLKSKVKFFCDYFDKSKQDYLHLKNKSKFNDSTIKFTSEILRHFERDSSLNFDNEKIKRSLYRPFVKRWAYVDKIITHRLYQQEKIFPLGNDETFENRCIGYIGKDTVIPFSALAFDSINDLNGLSNAAGGTKTFPLYTYDDKGDRHVNITDWALEEFREHYGNEAETRPLGRVQNSKGSKNEENLPTPNVKNSEQSTDENTLPNGRVSAMESEAKDKVSRRECTTPRANMSKRHIFHYVYAVLHNPAYRKKYELNLKRDFPRIPFYEDFNKWTRWGEELMDLHINYETAKKYKLERKDVIKKGETKPFSEYLGEEFDPNKKPPKPKLKADKESGTIYIDSNTTLYGVPEIAWEYKLGNRSALEWILDQYKEKKPRDKTIREKFNNYRFNDYKEDVIKLLQKVCTVSIKTMEIVREMQMLDMHEE